MYDSLDTAERSLSACDTTAASHGTAITRSRRRSLAAVEHNGSERGGGTHANNPRQISKASVGHRTWNILRKCCQLCDELDDTNTDKHSPPNTGVKRTSVDKSSIPIKPMIKATLTRMRTSQKVTPVVELNEKVNAQLLETSSRKIFQSGKHVGQPASSSCRDDVVGRATDRIEKKADSVSGNHKFASFMVPKLGHSSRRQGALRPSCLVRTSTQRESRQARLRKISGSPIAVKFDLTAHSSIKLRPWHECHLPHDDTFGATWRMLRIALYTHTVFRFPYRAAFGYGNFWHDTDDYLGDLIPDTFFCVDMCLLHFFSYKKWGTDETIQDLRLIRAEYKRWTSLLNASPSFWLDLVSVVPLHIAVHASVSEIVVQIAALPRITRIIKLFKWFSRSEVDIYSDYRLIALFKFSIMLVGAAHWVGCMWFFMARLRNFKSSTWIVQYAQQFVNYNEDDDDDDDEYDERYKYPHRRKEWKNYQISLFYGFYSMTAFGYTTIPNNDSECIYAILLCIAQLVYSAYILGTLFHYVVKNDNRVENFRKRMKAVEAYAESRKLPAELAGRMKRYFSFAMNKAHSSHDRILSRMPSSLVTKIARWQHLKLVQGSHVFDGVPEQYVSMLLVKLRVRYLEPGEVLFKLGDMSKELCCIQSGKIDEFEDATFRRLIRSISQGVVGELAFFVGIVQPCIATASTESDVVLQSISKEDYEEIADAYTEGHSIAVNNIIRQLQIKIAHDDVVARESNEASSSNKLDVDSKPIDAAARTGVSQTGAGNGAAAYREIVRTQVSAMLMRQKEDELSTMIDAALEGDLETIRKFIHMGVDVNVRDYDFRTMLHLSSAEGNLRVVRLLLHEGAEVSVKDRWGNTPLHDAIRGDHQQVAQLLAAKGASLEYDDPAGVLCNLVAQGDFDGLKNNIEFGTPVNAADYDSRTALHVAAAHGNHNFVTWLLQSKVDVNCMDRWGNTPLVNAVRNLHELSAKILFEAGGEMHHEYASSLLCEAALRGDRVYLKLLHECGTDVRASDYDRRTALHLASAEGQLVSVDFLLSAKAQVNFRDRCDRILFGVYSVVQSPNLSYEWWREYVRLRWNGTAMDDALRGEHYEVARLLQAAGGLPSRPLMPEQTAKLDAVNLCELREALREQVQAQENARRKQQQIRDAISQIAREFMLTLAQLEEPLASVNKVAASAMRKCDQVGQAPVKLGEGVQAYCFDMPNLESTTRTSMSAVSKTGTNDDVCMGAELDRKESSSSELNNFAMRRFVGLGDLPNLNPPPDGLLIEDNFGSETVQGMNQEQHSSEQLGRCSTVALPCSPVGKTEDSCDEAKQMTESLVASSDAAMHHPKLVSLTKNLEVSSGLCENAHADYGTINDAKSDNSRGSNDEVNFSLAVARNTILNSRPAQVQKFNPHDAGVLAPKMTSFNKIILNFPTIGKLFRILRYKAESFQEKEWAPHSVSHDWIDDEAITESDEMHIRRISLQSSTTSQTYQASDSIRNLHFGIAAMDSRPCNLALSKEQVLRFLRTINVFASIQEVSEMFLNVLEGGIDDVESPTLNFTQLVSSETFQRLLERSLSNKYGIMRDFDLERQGEATQNLEDTQDDMKQLVVGLVSTYRTINAAYTTLDRGGRGHLTIQALKNVIGGELRFGNELISLFEGRDFITRADFLTYVLRWLMIIDGDESCPKEQSTPTQQHQSMLNTQKGDERNCDQWHSSQFVTNFVDHLHECHPRLASILKGGRVMGEDDGKYGSGFLEEVFLAVAVAFWGAKLERKALLFWRELHKSLRWWYFQWRSKMEIKAQYGYSHPTGWLVRCCTFQHVEYVFKDIDKDDSGTLDIEEFRIFIDRLSIEYPVPLYKVYQTFYRISRGEAHIDFESFQNLWLTLNGSHTKRGSRFAPSTSSGHSAKLNHHPFGTQAWILPGSTTDRVCKALALGCAVYYVATVPYHIAHFNNFIRHKKEVVSSMYVADILLWLMICRNFFTVYTNRRSVYERSLSKVRRHYFKTGFVYDLISAAPLDVVVWVSRGNLDAVVWSRLPRFLRVSDIYQCLLNQRQTMSRIRSELHILLVTLALMLHVLACAWTTLTTGSKGRNYQKAYSTDGYSGYGSAARSDGDLQIDQYIFSLFFVCARLTGIGTGTLHPATNKERWFGILLMVCNLSILAYLLGTISSLFMSADEQVVAMRAEIAAANEFIEHRQLPSELQDEIRSYCYFQANEKANNDIDDNYIFRDLSYTLQVDVAKHISRSLIVNSTCFNACSDNFVDTLSTMLTETTFPPASLLFRNADIARTLYFVSLGCVELLIGGQDRDSHVDSIVEHGAVAPIPFLFGLRQTCAARTTEGQMCRLFSLERESFKRLVKLYPAEEDNISHNVLDVEDDKESTGSDAYISRGSRNSKEHVLVGVAKLRPSSASRNNRSLHDSSRHMQVDDDSDSQSSISSSKTTNDYRAINSIHKAILKARCKKEKETVAACCKAASAGNLAYLKTLLIQSRGAGIDCFPEDHQLLTSKGFMFIDDILAYKSGDLLFAGYDVERATIIYEKPFRIIMSKRCAHKMILFERVIDEAGQGALNQGGLRVPLDITELPARAAVETSNATCRDNKENIVMKSSADATIGITTFRDNVTKIDKQSQSIYEIADYDPRHALSQSSKFHKSDYLNLVSVLTTPFHDMFVCEEDTGRLKFQQNNNAMTELIQDATKPQVPTGFTKKKAASFIGNVAEEPLKCFRFLSHAAGGVDSLRNVDARSEVRTLYAKLRLNTIKQKRAFLELYGFWLGNSSLRFNLWSEKPAAVCFYQVFNERFEYVAHRLELLDTKYSIARSYASEEIFEFEWQIRESAWIDFFFMDYASESEPLSPTIFARFSHQSVQFPPWIFGLLRDEARAVIRGIRAADIRASCEEHAIYTHSTPFRDGLVRLCLHAGFAANYYQCYGSRVTRPCGRAINSLPLRIQERWAVHYWDHPRLTEPELCTKPDVKVVTYLGRVWCVTMPHGFLIVRRALRRHGIIFKTSIPTIQGNSGDYDSRTALHLAASNGHNHVVQWLIENGADVHCKDRFGNQPIQDAIRHKHDAVVSILREAGSTLELSDALAANLLCNSAHKGDLAEIERVVSNNINPNVSDYDGRTCLHIAAAEGRCDILKYLLSCQANVNATDRTGSTPLSAAVRSKQDKAQKLLRDAGGTINHDENAASELCRLAAQGDVDAIKVLVSNGLDINHGDYDSRRALHLACSEGRLGMVEYLLSCPSVDVNVVDRFGGTPLDDTIRSGHESASIVLAKHGAVRSNHPSLESRKKASRDILIRRRQLRNEAEARMINKMKLVHDISTRLNGVVKRMSKDNKHLLNLIQTLYVITNNRTVNSRNSTLQIPVIGVEEVVSPKLFLPAFKKFMESKKHAASILECYFQCMQYQANPNYAILDTIYSTFLTSDSDSQVNASVDAVKAVKQCLKFKSARRTPSRDVVAGVLSYIRNKLAEYTRMFEDSHGYQDALNSRVGRLWRLLSLAKSIDQQISNLMAQNVDVLTTVLAQDIVQRVFGDRSDYVTNLKCMIGRYKESLSSLRMNLVQIAVTSKVVYRRAIHERNIGSENEQKDGAQIGASLRHWTTRRRHSVASSIMSKF